MRVLLLALLLCGCTKNHEELRARLADVDRQLATQQAAAQRLMEDRRAIDTQLRITQLAKVIGEAGHLAARRQHVQRQMALIRQRHTAVPK